MKLNTQNVSLKISAGTADQFPKEPIPQIVFSGKSNVGKSSLINMLLGRKSLARVSSAPGKTITVNFYDIDRKLYFVDLPGYGFAKRPPEERAKWSKLTDSYVRSAHSSKKLFLQLIDCKSGPSEDDVNMVRWLETNGVPYVIVATKCDKPNKTDRETVLSILRERGRHVIPCSSETGEGKNEIWAEIFRVTGL
ncbi:MAG: ribosome biogenesis GTP-binding protein YihA/YsxC [Lachnospiraceae bacterium]|nr:ribosome biogenesis GTP-binding protein YihA/YsxC [Lachnospiraceae bacterium]